MARPSEHDADSDLHPLGQVIASVLEDGPRGRVTLSDQGLDYIRRALDEYLDAGDDLMAAVDVLLLSAHHIEIEQGARSIAERLVTLVDRPEVIAVMRQVTEAAETRHAQEVAQSAEKFSRFTGAAEPSYGPTSTAQNQPGNKPKGAVRLGDLAFPKRL